MFRPRFALLFVLLAPAGCATGGSFPSLAPRAVEQLSFEEPVKVDPPVAVDPALRGRFAGLLAEARRGDGAFEAEFARALPRVRGAGAPGSDSWVQAQEAISRVEAARTVTTAALADYDRLLSEQSATPVNDAVWDDILAMRAAAEALVADQTRRLDGLKASAGTR